MIELVVILLSGFALIRPLIGGWWIWLYYVSAETGRRRRRRRQRCCHSCTSSNPPASPHSPPSLLALLQINPMSWIFRAITINEFTSPRWNVPALAKDGQPLGEFTLNQWGMWPRYQVSGWGP